MLGGLSGGLWDLLDNALHSAAISAPVNDWSAESWTFSLLISSGLQSLRWLQPDPLTCQRSSKTILPAHLQLPTHLVFGKTGLWPFLLDLSAYMQWKMLCGPRFSS